MKRGEYTFAHCEDCSLTFPDEPLVRAHLEDTYQSSTTGMSHRVARMVDVHESHCPNPPKEDDLNVRHR